MAKSTCTSGVYNLFYKYVNNPMYFPDKSECVNYIQTHKTHTSTPTKQIISHALTPHHTRSHPHQISSRNHITG